MTTELTEAFSPQPVEPAMYSTETPGLKGPGPFLATDELARLRSAKLRLGKLYPEPIALLVGYELSAWEAHGYRYDQCGLIRRVVDAVLSAPEPA